MKNFVFFGLFVCILVGSIFGIDVKSSTDPAAVTSITDSSLKATQFKIAGVVFEFGKSRQESDFKKLSAAGPLAILKEWDNLFQNGNAIVLQRSSTGLVALQYDDKGFLIDLQIQYIMLSDLVKAKFALPKVKGTVNYGNHSYVYEDKSVFLVIQYNDLSAIEEKQGILKFQFGYKL